MVDLGFLGDYNTNSSRFDEVGIFEVVMLPMAVRWETWVSAQRQKCSNDEWYD